MTSSDFVPTNIKGSCPHCGKIWISTPDWGHLSYEDSKNYCDGSCHLNFVM